MPDSVRHTNCVPTIVIIDALILRRAGIVSLLEPWAAAAGLRLNSLSPSDVCQEFNQASECRLIVYSLGGGSLRQAGNLQPIEQLRTIAPQIPIVIVSDHALGDEVAAALRVGVQGFIHTDLAPELALRAFGFILNGGSYFPPAAIRDMQPGLHRANGAAFHDHGDHKTGIQSTVGFAELEPFAHANGKIPNLTGRQREVLERVCQGEPNKQIARRLGMTEGTVKVHVRQIMRKLGATNRTQVAVCASADAWPGHNGFAYKKAGE
jgi:DNA-binding NarL/FixJ family response regulator